MKLKYKNPVLIYNPFSGGGYSRRKLKKYIFYLNENLFKEISIYESTSKEDMQKYIIKICKKKKHDLIISIGGDGTISSIANALMMVQKNIRIPLFPIPAGSGDSVVRDFNIINIKDAVDNYKIIEKPKKFDLLMVEEKNSDFKYYCINVLGMAFVYVIAECAVKYWKTLGSFSYFIGALKGLKDFKPYKTTLICDGKKHNFEKVYFLTVSNTKHTGGAVKIAPDAEYNDGIMDIIIFHDISRFKFISKYFTAFKGNHIKEKGCTYIRCKKLEIFSEPDFNLMPDGELMGRSPVKVSVLKEEIPIII